VAVLRHPISASPPRLLFRTAGEIPPPDFRVSTPAAISDGWRNTATRFPRLFPGCYFGRLAKYRHPISAPLPRGFFGLGELAVCGFFGNFVNLIKL